ncbi:MAG: hypothetical protein JSR53_16095 [Proteobacteria bacterium]|nr:hypothetical protein [Pseudomonadota bacterium]
MSRASDLMGASAPAWTSGKTYYPSDVVKSPADNYMPYVRVTAMGSGSTDPASDSVNYKPFGARAIKSIQRGVISLTPPAQTVAVTIAAVNVAKTELRILGGVPGNSGISDLIQIVLTSQTTITATKNIAPAGATNTATASWELTEFY